MNSRHVKMGVAAVTVGVALFYGWLETFRWEAVKKLDRKK